MRNRIATLLLFFCALAGVSLADEAAATQAARSRAAASIVRNNRDAVIHVSAVLSVETGATGMPGRKQEQKIETVGTIVDPSGLTVVSLVTLDPSSMMGEKTSISIGGQTIEITIRADLSNIRMWLPDGTDIPAKLVLKDPDLDLAFVLPEKQEGKKLPRFSAVQPGKAPVLRELDDVITLSRLPKAINRETYVELDQVSGIVRKPRTFYCCALESAPPFLLGSPAFSRDGSLAGFWLIHKGPSSQASGLQGLLAMARTGPVVLPCADVMDVARQALKNPAGQSPQKTEDPKPESKDKPAESGKTEDSKTPER